MNRRQSLKTMMVGSLSAGMLIGCREESTDKDKVVEAPQLLYGRTKEEIERDRKLLGYTFFTETEMVVITLLSEIVIPADEEGAGAIEAEVPAFIEFMVKDKPELQTALRGGIMWLNSVSVSNYGEIFANIGESDRLSLVDQIANLKEVKQEYRQGAQFFNLLRNLVASGYFTSREGIAYLDYKGNTANDWDGVPEDVLKKYGLQYEERLLDSYLKMEDRGRLMDWAE